jgi:hypothetical protein
LFGHLAKNLASRCHKVKRIVAGPFAKGNWLQSVTFVIITAAAYFQRTLSFYTAEAVPPVRGAAVSWLAISGAIKSVTQRVLRLVGHFQKETRHAVNRRPEK